MLPRLDRRDPFRRDLGHAAERLRPSRSSRQPRRCSPRRPDPSSCASLATSSSSIADDQRISVAPASRFARGSIRFFMIAAIGHVGAQRLRGASSAHNALRLAARRVSPSGTITTSTASRLAARRSSSPAARSPPPSRPPACAGRRALRSARRSGRRRAPCPARPAGR